MTCLRELFKRMRRVSMIAGLSALIIVVSARASSAYAEVTDSESNSPRIKTRVYISTYTEDGTDGIFLTELDHEAGNLQPLRRVSSLKKASFLALHPNHRFLYSTCEVDDYADSKHGAVAAFKIDPAAGNLSLLNHQSSAGEGPHHLSLDHEGKYALVANYHGGSIAVLPIGTDGTLRPAASTVRHHGSSVNKIRQDGPHPHAINVDSTNHFVFVPDLGLDKVLAYHFDFGRGTLTANEPGALTTSSGAGPRHLAFHPNGKWAYVINELDSTIDVTQYDAKHGVLTRTESISTLPAGATQENITGEIVVHPNGKFLYASNRGHDSIAAYAINQSNGRLCSLGYYPAGGRTPRNFNIDPSGKFLLSANLDSDSVTVLRIDSSSGTLSSTDHAIKITQPYCIEFLSK
jgi:6-phosphogluconolactonase